MSTFNAHATSLWERARDDYLAGDTAAQVCARYGLSRSQFYAQARMGGWRKADQPGVAPELFAVPSPSLDDDGALDDDGPECGPAELARQALRRGGRAVARGRLAEAQGWVRLAARLRTLAMQDDDGAWTRAQRREARDDAVACEDAIASAPDAVPDPGDDALAAVVELGRIAQDAAALVETPPGPARDAAERALLARTAVLEARVADRTAEPTGCTTEGDGPAPDGPDTIFAAPSASAVPAFFPGPREGPDWAAYCRARAAAYPEDGGWLVWAQAAEAGLRA